MFRFSISVAVGLFVAVVMANGIKVGLCQDPYYGGYHSSTAAEGQARGMAEVIRSAGEYNLNTAQAATEAQQARKKSMENDMLYAQNFWEKRQLYEQNKATKKKPSYTAETAARRAAEATPDRLTTADVDPISGAIAWPAPLQDPKFDDVRQQLDELFAARATSGGAIGPAMFKQIETSIKSSQSVLRENISSFSSADYLASKKFLSSLLHEARFSTG